MLERRINKALKESLDKTIEEVFKRNIKKTNWRFNISIKWNTRYTSNKDFWSRKRYVKK